MGNVQTSVILSVKHYRQNPLNPSLFKLQKMECTLDCWNRMSVKFVKSETANTVR
jgi:hypothetical protein